MAKVFWKKEEITAIARQVVDLRLGDPLRALTILVKEAQKKVLPKERQRVLPVIPENLVDAIEELWISEILEYVRPPEKRITDFTAEEIQAEYIRRELNVVKQVVTETTFAKPLAPLPALEKPKKPQVLVFGVWPAMANHIRQKEDRVEWEFREPSSTKYAIRPEVDFVIVVNGAVTGDPLHRVMRNCGKRPHVHTPQGQSSILQAVKGHFQWDEFRPRFPENYTHKGLH